MKQPILAFDIETIPDVNGIRLLHDLPHTVPDHDVVTFAQQKRRAQTGSDFDRAVDEVKRTNGQVSFENAVRSQRRIEPDDTWPGSY